MEFFLQAESSGGLRFDVEVDAEPSHTVEDLTDALAKFFGFASGVGLVAYRSDGSPLLAYTTIAQAGIVSGETIHILSEEETFTPANVTADGSLVIAVTAGPDSGTELALHPGEFTISRADTASLQLSDPHISAVSDHHIRIVAESNKTVTVYPAANLTNEIRVNGTPITGPVVLSHDDVVRIGSTSLRLRTTPTISDKVRDVFGQVPFHRTPYYPAPVEPAKIEPIGSVPKKPEPNRFTYISAVAPIMMGVTFYLLYENPRFLIFIVFSPLIVVLNYFDQRRRSGKKFRQSIERFRENLIEKTAEVRATIWAERKRKFVGSPDVADLAGRAENRTVDLWVRDRDAYDYLTVRIGTGDASTEVELRAEQSGDQNFIDEMDAAIGQTKLHRDIPVSINLAELGVVGLVGPNEETTALATSIATQVSCLHSPEDLVIYSACSDNRIFNEWLKWIPHCRTASSPIEGKQLVSSKQNTDNLLRNLSAVAAYRIEKGPKNHGLFPWILVFLDKATSPDPALLSRLLDMCPDAGISVVWLTDSEARVPRQAQAAVTCRPLVTGQLSVVAFTNPTRADQLLHLEQLTPTAASRVGCSLAPLRDASSANAVTAIPKIVPLFTSLSVDEVTPEWIISQWNLDRGYAIKGPIGMTETGPLELDLVAHGPHALIGGTSGAGKSELLMSLVASMISYNPPTVVNFLFIDYKGGASSDLFKDMPHTVGYVTNLDGLLSLRALTSLRAELDRRMNLMQGRAKDVAEMIEKFPDEAPPSLVIVIDEFATLVKEIPDFVSGMVDIAQRGRSLGIHLILATQRPSGAINENIKANTNLRISLRMLDNAESSAVIGTPDAAAIPGPLKGRGYARFGHGDLVAFQSAWAGAPRARAEGPPPVTASSFTTLDIPKLKVQSGEPVENNAGGDDGPELTQIDTVFSSIIEATKRTGHKRGRRPWKDELPALVPLSETLADERLTDPRTPGRQVVIGMIDSPSTQDQFPAVLDLEAGGGLLVFGTGASGKTTFLQTIAASAAADDSAAGGNQLTIFGLDFASRELAILNRLPQCAGIGLSDNFETVTRIVATLDKELERRRSLLSAAAERAEAKPTFTSILFLIDNYENLLQAMESGPTSRLFSGWVERINNIIIEGRQVGIHSVITTTRRGGVRSNVQSAISHLLFFRQTDTAIYSEVGIRSADAKTIELTPGQGFLGNSNIFQAAMLTQPGSDNASTPDETTSHPIVSFAERLTGQVDPRLATKPLPKTIQLPDRGYSASNPAIGIADMTLEDYRIDLTYNNLAVLGDPRSGRSTVLATLAEQVSRGGGEVWALGPESSALRNLDCYKNAAFGSEEEITELLADLADVAAEGNRTIKPLVLFDDAELLEGRALEKAIGAVLSKVRWVGSSTSTRGYTSNPIMAEMKKARSLMILQPSDPRVVQETSGVLPNWRPGLPMPVGRAAVVVDRMVTYVQCFDAFTAGESEL